MNNVRMNIGMQIFLGHIDFISLGTVLNSEIPESCGNSVIRVLRKYFFHYGSAIYIFTSSVQRFASLPDLTVSLGRFF